MGSFANRRETNETGLTVPGITRREALALAAFGLVAAPGFAFAAEPEGRLTWGIHVSLAPTWFDPAETPGIITPFMVLYALHDGMVKPMPGQPLAPSLAESFSASEDGLSYEFALRGGAKFHNGDPVTAEDVKFSFERYRGTSHDLMKNRIAEVETPDPQHIRFKLQAPGVQVDPRRDHAAGGTATWRGRHRLLDPRRACRGAAAHTGAHSQAGIIPGPVLDLLRRPVGHEVALV